MVEKVAMNTATEPVDLTFFPSLPVDPDIYPAHRVKPDFQEAIKMGKQLKYLPSKAVKHYQEAKIIDLLLKGLRGK
jgi:hypothetical protein